MYWLLFSSAFTVARITVYGTLPLSTDKLTAVLQQEFSRVRGGIFPMRNIWIFNAQSLEQRLAQAFVLENIQVSKKRPHTVIIEINQKPRAMFWISRGIYYVIDEQGSVLGEVENYTVDTAGQAPILIYDESGAVPEIGKVVIPQNTRSDIVRLMSDSGIGVLKPDFWLIPQAGSSILKLKVDEGWKIYFDNQADLGAQVKNLNLILQNSIPSDKRKLLDYLDLRFGEKLYYKYR